MGRGWMQGMKNDNAQKRGAIFTKLSKEISVAARLGGPDPDSNARLRGAMEDARKASMPRDNIERAVKKGAGLLEAMAYEDVMYEGYGPHGVAVMVEALTDNRNRTVSELRNIFKRAEGSLGETNSVKFMFQYTGVIDATKSPLPEDAESEAIEVGAQNVAKGHEENHIEFQTEPTDLETVRKALIERGWAITTSELSYLPKNATELEGEAKAEVVAFLNELNDNEDVKKVHATLA